MPFASFDDFHELLGTPRTPDDVRSVDTWLHARIKQERYQFAHQLPLAHTHG